MARFNRRFRKRQELELGRKQAVELPTPSKKVPDRQDSIPTPEKVEDIFSGINPEREVGKRWTS
jgi:hypothetical protein